MIRKTTKTIPLSKLHLNSGQLGWLPRNPRQWTREDMDQMVASLNEDPDFMQDRPPLVVALPDKPGHFVVFAGNERTQGEKERKAVKTLDCIVYEGDFDNDPDDRLTVIRRAIKDNGHYAKNDTDIIANEWAEYADQFAAWGNPPAWDVPEEGTDEEGAGSAHEDDFDETKDEIHVICAKGDIWELGDHRLMCGDSVDLEQVKTLMGGGTIKADMVFTDPPYGVSIGDKNAELNTVQPSGRC